MADETTANNPTDAGTSQAATDNAATAASTNATEQQTGENAANQHGADGEAKPTGETKPDEAKPEGAPEKYEFKAPEGKEFDASVIDSFSNAAKAANLTQDAAQKLLETMAPKLAERQQEQIDAVRTQWKTASETDKEFGGDKFQENLGIAKKAVDTFGTPELRTLLESSGLGNNPEMIRFFYRAGKAISEDKFVTGAPNNNGRANVADVLYPNTKKE